MDRKAFRQFWDQFVKHVTLPRLAVDLALSVVLYLASRISSFATAFQPENEIVFGLCLTIAYFGVILVIRSIFAEATSVPILTPQIDSHLVAPIQSGLLDPHRDPTKGSTVFLTVSIRNSGMPTILEHWEAWMILSDNSQHRGSLHALPQNLTLEGPWGQRKFTSKDALYDKCTETPILTGAMVRGLLLVVFANIKTELFEQPGHQIRLKFKDVLGKEYITEVGTSVANSEPPRYHPGAGSPYIMKPPDPDTPSSATQSTS